MSAKVDSRVPTQSESEVLRMLWKYPDSTAREIHQENCLNRPRVVTTTAKILEIMLRKRLVTRDDSKRPYRYRAFVGRAVVQESVLTKMLGDLFDNRVADLIGASIESGILSIQDARSAVKRYSQVIESRTQL